MSVPGGGSAAGPRDIGDWACRIGERLPAADVRRLAEAAAAGELGARQLRAAAGSVILRDACDQLSTRLAYAEPAYLSGLLAGAARAESGVSSSRLTAAAVIDRFVVPADRRGGDRPDQLGPLGDPASELRDPERTLD